LQFRNRLIRIGGLMDAIAALAQELRHVHPDQRVIFHKQYGLWRSTNPSRAVVCHFGFQSDLSVIREDAKMVPKKSRIAAGHRIRAGPVKARPGPSRLAQISNSTPISMICAPGILK
jgi:hypothetical protein